MGFLNKLFNKKPDPISISPSEAETSENDENWVTFLTSISEEDVGSIIVDLGLETRAPDPERSILVTISIELLEKTENSLPTAAERETIDLIELALCKDLVERHDAVSPGHLFAFNRLDIFFYVETLTAIDQSVSFRMTDFPSYNFTVKDSIEEDWETYLNLLYPTPIQMQSISNQQVIANLLSHGDSLQIERPVEHWIYFGTNDARDKFITAISKMGFEILNQSFDEETEEPFGLHISRIDRVDPESADEYTLELWQIAHDCGGLYDGWETSIINNDESDSLH